MRWSSPCSYRSSFKTIPKTSLLNVCIYVKSVVTDLLLLDIDKLDIES